MWSHRTEAKQYTQNRWINAELKQLKADEENETIEYPSKKIKRRLRFGHWWMIARRVSRSGCVKDSEWSFWSGRTTYGSTLLERWETSSRCGSKSSNSAQALWEIWQSGTKMLKVFKPDATSTNSSQSVKVNAKNQFQWLKVWKRAKYSKTAMLSKISISSDKCFNLVNRDNPTKASSFCVKFEKILKRSRSGNFCKHIGTRAWPSKKIDFICSEDLGNAYVWPRKRTPKRLQS